MPLAEIGEQTYALSREFKDAHPDGEWSYVSGMRHRLVHNYELPSVGLRDHRATPSSSIACSKGLPSCISRRSYTSTRLPDAS